MNLRKDYFVPGSHHVCMFCGTPIGKLINGSIYPLGNKIHVLLGRDDDNPYVINACANCAYEVDFSKQPTLNDIHKNVMACREILWQREGKSHAEITRLKVFYNSYKPRADFARIELKTDERQKHLTAYKEHVKNAR